MKRVLLLAACCATLAAGLAPAGAATVTVSSNPLWTDTGITLSPQCGVTIIHGATGLWNYGGAPFDLGPDGLYTPLIAYDQWITSGNHGELIGFIGDNPYSVGQNDPQFFIVGSGTVTLSGASGHLWLGFNDDFASGNIGDNTGSMTVQVDSVSQIRPLYDPTKAVKAGSTLPIKIQVLDCGGNNTSSSSLAVHALNVVQVSSSASTTVVDDGNANPDFDFRYDTTLAGYIFNLKTTGLTTGTYQLFFTVGGGPVFSTPFEVR